MKDFVNEKEVEEVIEEKGYAKVDTVEDDESSEDVEQIVYRLIEKIRRESCRHMHFEDVIMVIVGLVAMLIAVLGIIAIAQCSARENAIPFKDQATIDAKQVVYVVQHEFKIPDKEMKEVVKVAKLYGYDVDDVSSQNDLAILFNVALAKVDSSVLKGNYKMKYDKVRGSWFERMSEYLTLYNKYMVELHEDDRQVTRAYLVALFNNNNLQLSKAKASTKDTFKQIDYRNKIKEDVNSEE